MAIYVLGAKADPEWNSEAIKRQCLKDGILDEDGNPFEIISLVSLIQVGENSTTQGNFEDTFIDATGTTIIIRNSPDGKDSGRAGRIKWQRSRSGQMVGELSKTPKNINALARNYFYGLFKIKDPIQDAEVRAIAEKIRGQMTEQEKSVHESLISKTGKSPYGGDMIDRDGKTSKEKADQIEKAGINQKVRELKEAESELKAKEKAIIGKAETKIKDGGSITKYTRETLMKEKTFTLKGIAKRDFGLQLSINEKRQEIVDKILEEQEKRNKDSEPKPPIITG